ncbi:MAG: TIGR00295 family protein [Candidatus Bathyarchaeota archaeon]|nr:TIGR00295 family protein [Candidatus Bathyarchaeota archaeon]MDH5687192.1 TIGR00295 family protein [Candidatus Bathyarchaeota archaeon]
MLRKSGCNPNVIRHSKAVAKISVEIAKELDRKMDVDVNLIKVGALLHDIGRSNTHSAEHAVVGAEIARSLGLPLRIISIIERHIGGGITRKEAKELGWPAKSYMPKTIEEKIVAYADKLIEGSKRVPIDRTIKSFEEKLGSEHAAIRRLERLHREMSSLLSDLEKAP